LKYFQGDPELYLPRGLPAPMNALLPPILFMVPIDAVAPSTSKHHIGENDAVKADGGELIPTIFTAQN
jgi:hypothetical protein